MLLYFIIVTQTAITTSCCLVITQRQYILCTITSSLVRGSWSAAHYETECITTVGVLRLHSTQMCSQNTLSVLYTAAAASHVRHNILF